MSFTREIPDRTREPKTNDELQYLRDHNTNFLSDLVFRARATNNGSNEIVNQAVDEQAEDAEEPPVAEEDQARLNMMYEDAELQAAEKAVEKINKRNFRKLQKQTLAADKLMDDVMAEIKRDAIAAKKAEKLKRKNDPKYAKACEEAEEKAKKAAEEAAAAPKKPPLVVPPAPYPWDVPVASPMPAHYKPPKFNKEQLKVGYDVFYSHWDDDSRPKPEE